jgi:RND family efflux transporter MFP subunit
MKHTLYLALAGLSLASGSAMFPGPEAVRSGSSVRGSALAEEPTWESVASKFGGTKADTKPCKDSLMAFTIPVEVREVLVKGGAVVKSGDVLVRARDDEQVAVVAGQELQAGNVNRIRNAELQKELADLNFKRIKEAKEKGGANEVEFDQRRIEASSAAIALALETTNNALEVKRLEQAKGLLGRYRLTAPFDGIVDEVRVVEGQGVRESDAVVRLVDIQRLQMDAYAPTQETLRLKLAPGAKAWVLVALPDKPMIVQGEVAEVSPVADSVSQTRRVRVEFRNSEGWPAGLPVMVRFSDPGADWAGYMLSAGTASAGGTGGNDGAMAGVGGAR